MFRAIKRVRIHEEVVSQIHDLIKDGRFKAGDQLPSERELAEIFKVSRTSVREALRALETQGLVISRTGAGNFVADLPIDSLIRPLAQFLIDEKKALADIFELRKLIEPRIASLAAERATRADIEQLKRILIKQTEAMKRGESGVEADAELHLAIGRATKNEALQKLVSGLMGVLSRSREESLQTDHRREESLDSHRKIIAAIEAHDKTETHNQMLRHIEQVEDIVLATDRTQRSHKEIGFKERRIS